MGASMLNFRRCLLRGGHLALSRLGIFLVDGGGIDDRNIHQCARGSVMFLSAELRKDRVVSP
jgi:hypothetical protein